MKSKYFATCFKSKIIWKLFLFISGVTILLSLTVFLNLVAETLPQVSDAIPLLGIQDAIKAYFINIIFNLNLITLK